MSDRRSKWLESCTSCKIGTMPMLVLVHGGDRMEVGKWVRVKYDRGGRWERVLITRVEPSGYFMADR